MLLNLTDILSNENKEETVSVCYEPGFYKVSGKQYKVMENGPIELKLQNLGKGKVLITGEGKVVLQARCDRCITRADITVEVFIEEEVTSEQIENPTDIDELPFMDGYQLDTEVLIGNELLINWPVKILCKEDCKGICPKCGKDLNQGDCGCDTFVPDPRMAVIQEIFNANKEV